MITVKKVESQAELEQAFAIRLSVFVQEQGVPKEIEMDENDQEAIHVIAFEGEEAVGCGRMLVIDPISVKLGRVAVKKEYRGKDIGTDICEKLFSIAREMNLKQATIHSQVSAKKFYQKLGFIQIGSEFEESGLLHVKMEKELFNSNIIIGIAGGTGSGKSTLVRKLKEALGEEVLALTHDDYYKSNDHLTREERKSLNYDHPNAFDTDMMIQHLLMLKKGESIYLPQYDFTHNNRSDETILVAPKKVIIVEGILIFENIELRKMFDIKVFVDTDADVRIIRRILRDVKERGRNLDSVIQQYLGTVKIMHEEFVEPSKKHADIIIPEGGYNKVACSMLLDKIKMLLNEVKSI